MTQGEDKKLHRRLKDLYDLAIMNLTDSFIGPGERHWFTDHMEDAFSNLIEKYSEPHRRYHTLQHLLESFFLLDTVGKGLSTPRVELALFYHDLVYDVPAYTTGSNEEMSAAWMAYDLMTLDIQIEDIHAIDRMIRLTRKHEGPETDEEKLLLDVDLAILGAEPDRYEQAAEQIRQEYAIATDDQWRIGRFKVLQGFLHRDRIYATDAFRERFEERARRNVMAELQKLAGNEDAYRRLLEEADGPA